MFFDWADDGAARFFLEVELGPDFSICRKIALAQK
jgi:hypothetical protein